jgi:uncharacterized protein (TIGR03437 family)
MKTRLGVLMLLVCPILAFAHNDPVPPLVSYYTGSKTFHDSVCSDCHNAGSTGNVQLLFNGVAATSYTPGATIPISIAINDTGGGRRTWGFELATRFSTGKTAGTLIAVNSNTTVNSLQFPSSGTVISHNGPVNFVGATFTFTVNWTAPASGSGNVYFSVAGNAANGDGDLTGDRIYTNEVILTPAVAVTPPSVSSGGVVNAASFNPAPSNQVAQGQLVSIFGSNFTTGGPYFAGAVPLPRVLGPGNTSVSACGVNLPLIYVSTNQINAQLPFECTNFSGTTPLTVTANTATSSGEPVSLATVSPGIFTLTSKGTGEDGVIVHGVGNGLISSTSPAHAGEIVVIYATGLGAVNTPVASGSAASGGDPTTATVTVTIGGQNAPVQYAGLTPGDVGLYQINVIVPTFAAAQSAPVLVTVSSNIFSRTGVTLAVAP